MSMNKLSPATRRAGTTVGLIFGLAGITTLWLFFRDKLPGSMANGMLAGGLVALIIFGFASWRAARNPARASSFERSVASRGDERDGRMLEKTLSVVGVVTLPLTSVATVALALEAPISMVMALLLWSEVLVGIVAFAVINKRT